MKWTKAGGQTPTGLSRPGQEPLHPFLADLPNAGPDECDHEAGANDVTPVVHHLKEWLKGNQMVPRKASDAKGGSMRLGPCTALLKPGSHVAAVYHATTIEERHRYEVDLHDRDHLSAKGLIIPGMSPEGKLPEIVEVKDHPSFIGAQFHPELKSKPFAPHPLFADFVRAAMGVERLV